MRFWAKYERLLQLYPVRTKAFVSASMFALTDVAVQHKTAHDSWSWKRTLAQALFGGYYGVLHAHIIWGLYEKFWRSGWLTMMTPGSLPAAACTVAIDQLVVGTPLFNTVFFYSTARLSVGLDHEEACAHVKQRLWPMLTKHWSFWVPFHTFNFWLVPYRHRLLPAQLALFGWSAFMSHAGAK